MCVGSDPVPVCHSAEALGEAPLVQKCGLRPQEDIWKSMYNSEALLKMDQYGEADYNQVITSNGSKIAVGDSEH